MPLSLFVSPIGSHKAAELNDALYTLFGELSAQPHSALAQEAAAIVSTMLNRLKTIAEARKAVATEKLNLESARRRVRRRSRPPRASARALQPSRRT
jgi:hypothetical protein